MKTLRIGYNTLNTGAYFELNLICTIIGFSIYKSYILSNNRTENTNIVSIFLKELYLMKQYLAYKGKSVKYITNILEYFWSFLFHVYNQKRVTIFRILRQDILIHPIIDSISIISITRCNLKFDLCYYREHCLFADKARPR